jgi:hypothetical protein
MGLGRGVAGAAALVGILAAVACPIAGAIAGGVLVWGATSATMGTGAAVALTAAGVVGGGVAGRLVGAVVAIAAVGLARLAASSRLVSNSDFKIKRNFANDDHAPSLSKKLGGLFSKASNDVADELPHGLKEDIKVKAPLQFKR